MLAQSSNSKLSSFRLVARAFFLAAAIAIPCGNGTLVAQIGGPGNGGIFLGTGGVVGGVEINPNGVLGNDAIKLSDDIRDQLQRGLQSVESDVSKPGLRMISLRALEEKMVQCRNSGKPFPPSVMYMAGLQRIEYVMLTPEKDDVIIAGPGEGFKTDADGNVVGATSGMPVIHLQDFLVAMRSVDDARRGSGISVSIDPTEEGIKNVHRVMRQLNAGNFDQSAARALEEAGGPQRITLTGVPKDSRFSQVLVAADYKMKRLAMGLEEAPEFLPSILAMAQQRNTSASKLTPRFWMECHYEPVAVSADKSIWKLAGKGVRTDVEGDFLKPDGTRASKRPDKLAKQWADTMSERFADLSKVQPVFRELRNMMDLSVVAAIIAKERLLEKVKLELPAIKGLDTISTPTWNVPQTVPTQCSFTRLSGSLMVTTSGGVMVDSWSVAANTAVDSKLAEFSAEALGNRADRWWWNAN